MKFKRVITKEKSDKRKLDYERLLSGLSTRGTYEDLKDMYKIVSLLLLTSGSNAHFIQFCPSPDPIIRRLKLRFTLDTNPSPIDSLVYRYPRSVHWIYILLSTDILFVVHSSGW